MNVPAGEPLANRPPGGVRRVLVRLEQMQVRRTKAEIYMHFVWCTIDRLPLIRPDCERALYRCMESQARKVGCTVLAIAGTDDHIHLLTRMPTRLSAAQLMQKVKGVSSTFGRDIAAPGGLFGWQEGYGVFSLGRNEVPRVMRYVLNQKKRHSAKRLWDEWEECDEEAPELNSAAA